MKNKIKFIARDKYIQQVLLPPVSASSLVPTWWKNGLPYHATSEFPGLNKLLVENKIPNFTFKRCVPMLDALTSGYILPLYTDVQVRNINEFKRITWKLKTLEPFAEHGLTSDQVERPFDCSLPVFKYNTLYSVRVPKGYSLLVTQPFGYRNTPFTLIPAVLDADSELLELSLPLWVKKDFEGVVERGTPIAQFIPFKRDDWKLELEAFEREEYYYIQDRVFGNTIINNYIKHHWKKKDYK